MTEELEYLHRDTVKALKQTVRENGVLLKERVVLRQQIAELEAQLQMWREGICPADVLTTHPSYDGPEVPGCQECPDQEGCVFQRQYNIVRNLREQIEMFLQALGIEGGVDGWLPKDLRAIVQRHKESAEGLAHVWVSSPDSRVPEVRTNPPDVAVPQRDGYYYEEDQDGRPTHWYRRRVRGVAPKLEGERE